MMISSSMIMLMLIIMLMLMLMIMLTLMLMLIIMLMLMIMLMLILWKGDSFDPERFFFGQKGISNTCRGDGRNLQHLSGQIAISLLMGGASHLPPPRTSHLPPPHPPGEK